MQTFNNGQERSILRIALNKELADGFGTLSDSSTVTIDTESKKLYAGAVTLSQSATLNITNTIDGQTGTLKVLTNTASAVAITFDTSFTNKRLGALGHETVTSYTLPAGTGKEYILSWVLVGTTMYWYVDGSVPQWTAFTQTLVGWTSAPTYTCRYIYDATRKIATMYITTAAATSNATTLTFQLPVAAANTELQYTVCQITNNGTSATGLAVTRVGSTTVDVYATTAFGAFTASGNKALRITLTWETI